MEIDEQLAGILSEVRDNMPVPCTAPTKEALLANIHTLVTTHFQKTMRPYPLRVLGARFGRAAKQHGLSVSEAVVMNSDLVMFSRGKRGKMVFSVEHVKAIRRVMLMDMKREYKYKEHPEMIEVDLSTRVRENMDILSNVEADSK